MALFRKSATLPAADAALPGRSAPLPVPHEHFVSGNPLRPPFAAPLEEAVFGLGCFWGAERLFWQLPGVFTTAAGYAGGYTPNPTYEEVCTGRTGHAEVVRGSTIRGPRVSRRCSGCSGSHDPTQGMRQGNDIGTQYRSAIYVTSAAQGQMAEASRRAYQARLAAAGLGTITPEIRAAPSFYYAEDYHQQYLAKNPQGYCGIGGCGVPYRAAGP